MAGAVGLFEERGLTSKHFMGGKKDWLLIKKIWKYLHFWLLPSLVVHPIDDCGKYPQRFVHLSISQK